MIWSSSLWGVISLLDSYIHDVSTRKEVESVELELVPSREALNQVVGLLQVLHGLKGVLEHQIKAAPEHPCLLNGGDRVNNVLLGLIPVKHVTAHPLGTGLDAHDYLRKSHLF